MKWLFAAGLFFSLSAASGLSAYCAWTGLFLSSTFEKGVSVRDGSTSSGRGHVGGGVHGGK